MLCENCDKEHLGFYGSGRFCSSKCARSFSTKDKRLEINEKVSKTHKEKGIKPPPYIRGIHGPSWTEEQKTERSKKMKEFFNEHPEAIENLRNKNLGKIKSEETKEKLRQSQYKLIKEGKHKGWKFNYSRKTKSYPEIYFEDVLNNHNIIFEMQYNIDRFFVDFAFIDKKAVLEIDGSIHFNTKDYDLNRDNIIKNCGWKIYHIDWNYIVNNRGNEIMQNKINNFLNWYDNL